MEQVSIMCPKCGSSNARHIKSVFAIDNTRLDELTWMEKFNCYGCGTDFIFKFIRGSIGCNQYFKTITTEVENGRTKEGE